MNKIYVEFVPRRADWQPIYLATHVQYRAKLSVGYGSMSDFPWYTVRFLVLPIGVEPTLDVVREWAQNLNFDDSPENPHPNWQPRARVQIVYLDLNGGSYSNNGAAYGY